MAKSKKHTLQLLCAIFLVCVGVGLAIAGFITPPLGEIHSSVLVMFGEILTFAGSLMGVDYKYKYKEMVRKDATPDHSMEETQ